GKKFVVAQNFLPPHYKRIRPKPSANLAHLALIRQSGWGTTEATQSPRRHDVGPYGARIDPHVGNLVRSGHRGAAVARDDGSNIAICTGIKISPHFAGHDHAVFLDAGLYADRCRVFAHRYKLFFPFENYLDWTVRLQRQERSDRLQSDGPFRSEAAAQSLANNPDSGQGEVE